MTGDYRPDEIVIVGHPPGDLYVRYGGCTRGCGACCREMIIPIDPALIRRPAFHGWRQWLESHGGIRLLVERGAVLIPLQCDHLQEGGSCAVHDSPERPQMCARYPRHPQDVLVDECTYGFVTVPDDITPDRARKLALRIERQRGLPPRREVPNDATIV